MVITLIVGGLICYGLATSPKSPVSKTIKKLTSDRITIKKYADNQVSLASRKSILGVKTYWSPCGKSSYNREGITWDIGEKKFPVEELEATVDALKRKLAALKAAKTIESKETTLL